ncbi:protein kinase [Streptomyces sp. NPDC096323]|uniref:serine/threonine-protein kinase n=1 Tax=Streptomyces sp. NPDC096323 TaxID=3155822 RepID=UPI003316FB8F
MRGSVLGERYELTERLGRGGMGQVWSARDSRMGRDVAVKLVTAIPHLGEQETFLRFRREVRSAASLPGRHTVSAYDCGEALVDDERVLYMVMERLTGRTLRQAVQDARPHWRVAVRWGRQVAVALDAAHRQRIVHRDIKPDNVMFAADGDLKVLDFGIAKFLGDTVRVNGLTGTGVALGSLLYMSPEQSRGDGGIDHRTDIYSLGCLLYFMLTGRPPIVVENVLALIYAQTANQAMPPHAVVDGVPVELSRLVMRLLAPRQDDRPGSAQEVLAQLDALHDATPRGVSAKTVPDRVTGGAEGEAAALLVKAQRDAQMKREEANALFEETRAKAAQAAADFETNLAKRRDQAERDLAERQQKAVTRIAAIEQRAERLRSEAEGLRADAGLRAQQSIDDARRRADDIISDATAHAHGLLDEATLEAFASLRETAEAVMADSKFMPVANLLVQRDDILRQLTALLASLAAVPRESRSLKVSFSELPDNVEGTGFAPA